MRIHDVRALVTGASGGIGNAIVAALLEWGAKVIATGRDERALTRMAHALNPAGDQLIIIPADVTQAADRRRLCAAAQSQFGGINVLINNAGVGEFGLFEDATHDHIERSFAVNVLAPMALSQDLLPYFQRLPAAHIVNVGSVFGTIAYPGHTVYSATKFALRGFSEALRRELADSSVHVHYLAPRATRTSFNSPAVEALNAQFGTAMDPPEHVAAALCSMLERGQSERVIGWPEKLFARINAVLPRLVDRALHKQLPAIKQQATGQPGSAALAPATHHR